MKIILFLAFFISISKAAEQPAAQRVYEQCVAKTNWTAVKCFMNNKSEDMYKINLSQEIIYTVTMGAIDTSANAVGELFNAGNILLEGRGRKGHEARQEVIEWLKAVRASKKLNDCQAACLIKCASKAVLKYEAIRYEGLYNTYEEGKGVCTEFSQVARDLGPALGIEVRQEYGFNHSFNSFKINGRWYLGEPQSNQCEFFTRDALAESELKSLSKKINQGIGESALTEFSPPKFKALQIFNSMQR